MSSDNHNPDLNSTSSLPTQSPTSQTTSSKSSSEQHIQNATHQDEIQEQGNSWFSSRMKNLWTKAAPALESAKKNLAQFVKTVNDDYFTSPESIGFYYVTKRLILAEYPDDTLTPSKVPLPPSSNPTSTDIDNQTLDNSKLAVMSAYLNRTHPNQYMVYNLSERNYDTSAFRNQVIDFSFPGYPVPPLEKLFEILLSIYGWLRADPKNVAVIHCLQGYGRAALVIAAFMGWIGYQQSNPRRCAELIALHLDQPISHVIVPSQARYLNYVSALMNSRYPSIKPLILERVVLVGIPSVENGGCRPYFQLYSQSKLVYTSTGRNNDGKLEWFAHDAGAAVFPVDVALQGNFLLRLRHLSSSGQRVSVVRAVLHTGYIQPGSLRLRVQDLDGGDSDLFGDFWLELAFREIDDDPKAELKVISDGAEVTGQLKPHGEDVTQDSEKLEETEDECKQRVSDEFWARISSMHKKRHEERMKQIAKEKEEEAAKEKQRQIEREEAQKAEEIEKQKEREIRAAEGTKSKMSMLSNLRDRLQKYTNTLHTTSDTNTTSASSSSQDQNTQNDTSDNTNLNEFLGTSNIPPTASMSTTLHFEDDGEDDGDLHIQIHDDGEAGDEIAEMEIYLKNMGVGLTGSIGSLPNPITSSSITDIQEENSTPSPTPVPSTISSPISLEGPLSGDALLEQLNEELNDMGVDFDDDDDDDDDMVFNINTRSPASIHNSNSETTDVKKDVKNIDSSELDLDSLMAELDIDLNSAPTDINLDNIDIDGLLDELP